MKTIQTIKIVVIFRCYCFNNLIVFLLQDNAIFLHLELLEKQLVFNNLSYVLKQMQDIFFFFIIQNIKSNCYIIFLNIFVIIFFWWKTYPFPVIFNCKSFNFYYSLRIFLFLHDLTWLLQRIGSIVTFLFFVKSGEATHDPPWFGFILWHF